MLSAPTWALGQGMQNRASLPAVRNVAISPAPQQPPLAPQQPHPAVARIYVVERGSQSLGSGTLIDVRDRYGLVVTNWHVIREAAGEISVVFPDGFRSAARVVKQDADWDLAALSIWRPPAAPLRISAEPPQPGEMLTLAGYGSDGNFRAVSGPCTQYMAPSNQLPHEIVELAAPARQGDSGGPILNTRGELAGVLFGTVDRTTSGSYGGRVLKFLDPLLKSDPSATSPPGAAPEASTNPVVSTATSAGSLRSLDTELKPRNYPGDFADRGTNAAEQHGADNLYVPLPAAPLAPVTEGVEETEYRIVHTPLQERGGSFVPSAEQPIFGSYTLQDFVGRTPIEQGKTALSLVGLLALALFAMRFGGRGSKQEE